MFTSHRSFLYAGGRLNALDCNWPFWGRKPPLADIVAMSLGKRLLDVSHVAGSDRRADRSAQTKSPAAIGPAGEA